MSCSSCGNPKVLAKGLCSKCYARMRRTGSLERTNVLNIGPCAFPGCDREAFAKGLCALHYAQADHPLKNIWKALRSRYPGEFPPAWGKFEMFLADIGERPSPKHQFRRKNPRLPYSSDNVEWVEPVGVGNPHYDPDNYAKYGREWRLRRKFKITGEEYDALLAAQGGVCAICGQDGTKRHARTGNAVLMHVDHDHATGKVRGILCSACNTSLGLFHDDPVLLRAAAAYIERHREAQAPIVIPIGTVVGEQKAHYDRLLAESFRVVP